MFSAEEKYKDIFNLPHHEPDPDKHPRMTILNRAAQFAPFAALTGFDDSINKAAKDNNCIEEKTEEEF